MALRIKSSQDFWSGCLFVAIGAGTAVLAQAHALGTPARMGPGFVPTLLGVLLAAVGVAVIVKSLLHAGGGNVARVDVLLLLRILLGVAVFAFLLQPLGLVLTAFLVVLVAAHAGHEFRLGETLVSAAVLSALSYLLFVRALGQPLPVWPWFAG